MYIVKEGECIYESEEGVGRIVRCGEFIGETQLITKKQPMRSTLKAVTNCVLLIFEALNWIEFLDKNPGFKLLVHEKVYFK